MTSFRAKVRLAVRVWRLSVRLRLGRPALLSLAVHEPAAPAAPRLTNSLILFGLLHEQATGRSGDRCPHRRVTMSRAPVRARELEPAGRGRRGRVLAILASAALTAGWPLCCRPLVVHVT
jgi:hypothetical protein